MCEIIEFAIARGILPVLSTKGDNVEGNHKINQGIVEVAAEFDLPLWNFWWTIQYLPQQGIDKDRGGNYLSVEAWNKRSYSGLRMLHLVYSELMELQANAPQWRTHLCERFALRIVGTQCETLLEPPGVFVQAILECSNLITWTPGGLV